MAAASRGVVQSISMESVSNFGPLVGIPPAGRPGICWSYVTDATVTGRKTEWDYDDRVMIVFTHNGFMCWFVTCHMSDGRVSFKSKVCLLFIMVERIQKLLTIPFANL